jgi:hypothetical protein
MLVSRPVSLDVTCGKEKETKVDAEYLSTVVRAKLYNLQNYRSPLATTLKYRKSPVPSNVESTSWDTLVLLQPDKI